MTLKEMKEFNGIGLIKTSTIIIFFQCLLQFILKLIGMSSHAEVQFHIIFGILWKTNINLLIKLHIITISKVKKTGVDYQMIKFVNLEVQDSYPNKEEAFLKFYKHVFPNEEWGDTDSFSRRNKKSRQRWLFLKVKRFLQKKKFLKISNTKKCQEKLDFQLN